MELPIIPELQRIIDANSTGDLTLLVTAFGKPFTANGFGNRFRKWCDDTGLGRCSARGLRKAAASRLAELGRSKYEIMVITGHTTSQEVGRYTCAARQKERAMMGFDYGQEGNESVPLSDASEPGGTNPGSKSLKR